MKFQQIKVSTREWICIKVPLITFNIIYFILLLLKTGSLVNEKGLCIPLNCNFLDNILAKITLLGFFLLFSIWYLMEKKMVIATFGIFAINILLFSLIESFGISDRTGIFALIWLAQSIAYYIHYKNDDDEKLIKNRILFPMQIIAAGYTLSGISKLITSGTSWFVDCKNVILQQIKTIQQSSLDSLTNTNTDAQIESSISLITNHETIFGLLLLGAITIELTCGLALINKRLRLIYGLLLLGMHIGIFYLFTIIILPFLQPLILFFINPLFILSNFIFNTKFEALWKRSS